MNSFCCRFSWVRGSGWWQPVVLAVLMLISSTGRAPAQTWQSAMALPPNAYVTATATDAAGNICLGGYFIGSASFGNTTLTSSGADDAFVALWNPGSNSYVWAQRAGGTGSDEVTALAIAGGNVFITGFFQSAGAGFGATTLTNANANNFSADFFVAKLSGLSGAIQWAKGAGGTRDDTAKAIAVNGSSVYVVGDFLSSSLTIGGNTLPNATPAFPDVFVFQLIDAGTTATFTWSQRAGGSGTDHARAVSATGSTVYVSGAFYGTANLWGGSYTSNGLTDGFISKFTATGSAVWTQPFGGQSDEEASALAVNGSAVYAAGYFYSSSVAFGPAALTNWVNNGNRNDVFVAKLSDAGNTASFTWALKAGGLEYDQASSIALNGASLYVAGTFGGSGASFGNQRATNSNANYTEVFVAKLTDGGSSAAYNWVQAGGGPYDDEVTGAAISASTVYVVGNAGYPSFGSIQLNGQSGFLASMSDNTALAAYKASHSLDVMHYPNPAHATITVELPKATGGFPVSISLADVLGRVVQVYTPALPVTGHTFPIALTGLANGTYYLHIQAGTYLATRRFVKD